MDFSEPYGTLVSASAAYDEGGGARVWDLASGEKLGHLFPPDGTREAVKCLQVNNTACLTGGTDAQIRLWDLSKVGSEFSNAPLDEVDDDDSGDSSTTHSHHINNAGGGGGIALVNTFRGHAQTISALYSEDACLASYVVSTQR